jgi:hypothetical protein
VNLAEALSRGHGTWRSFSCPAHSASHDTARVNVLTGKWVCMSCGAKGTTDGWLADPDEELEAIMDILEPPVGPKSESWLDVFDSGPIHPYWLSRYEENTCREFRLGYDAGKGKPCYPIRDPEGRPLGVVLRNLDDPSAPKYRYPVGVGASKLLFGYERLYQHEPLVLCEGATDVMAAFEAGFWAVGSFGARISETQSHLILAAKPTTVVIAYDMDKAGEEGAHHAHEVLSRLGVITVRPRWDGYKDLGEMPKATRRKILTEALAISST